MSLIPATDFDSIVAMGFPDGDGEVRYLATGFLLGRLAPRRKTRASGYHLFLVTNRHVVTGESRAHLRFNPEADGPAHEYQLPLADKKGRPLWTGHPEPDVDVAVVPLDPAHLRREKIRFAFFLGDRAPVARRAARRRDIGEGDAVFVLGFPMGLVGEGRSFVIVRQGILARYRDVLGGASRKFLVDAPIFPGNSGGPVLLRPACEARARPASRRGFLLGIVAGYVPYQDVAVSSQTNRPRIIFEENSGLTSAFPADDVLAVVERARTPYRSTGLRPPRAVRRRRRTKAR